ncbi:class I adenylate-forming enzyme family protein [Pyrofollis japonicus]|uniref:class I adenylate-forming enzyme family protein n=1 Tax=Pyrofollis japonicus TaxID=3060460 RepID=UPI00295AA486|nr:class I adenylate-forming enzyme family protein [Pyrofollis japonicus]
MSWYPGSPVDYLLHCATVAEESRICDTEGRCITYSGLLVAASRVAEKFSGLVKEGSVAAVAPVNNLPGLVALFAAWLAGLRVAVVDPLSGEWDLRVQLSQARPGLLVVSWDGVEMCRVAEGLGARCIVAEDLYDSVTGSTSPWEGYWRPRPWEELLYYFYAGIAGRSLPVAHTGASLAASGMLTATHFGLEQGSRVYVPVPISHGLGLQIAVFGAMYTCSSIVLYTKRGPLDPREAARSLAESRASHVFSVPLYYKAVLKTGYRGHNGLVAAISAGSPMLPGLQREWRSRTGAPLLQLYGMTEALPITATRPGDPDCSIGRPLPGIETRIMGRSDEGELLVRGPVVMKRYLDEEENEKAFLGRGWLRTGDVVRIDSSGNYYFVRIVKPMLKYKAYPVLIRDLKELLTQHPDVAKAEIMSVDMGDLGEAAAARVWLRKGARVSEHELLEWVNSRVAPYRRLYRVEVMGYA